MVDEDEEEYCADCGDPEYDKDGNETHADEEKYDHDFVYEEEDEEDDGLTLDDVKKGAETISSIAKAVKDIKDLSDDPKLEITKAGDEAVKKARKKGFAGHEVPQPHTNWLWDTLRPPAPDERKPGTWDRYLFKVRKPRSEVEEKLDRIEKKIDKSSKHQNRKWYIGLGVAVVLAIIGLLIF